MRAANGCAACAADRARGLQPAAAVACARMRAKTPQWWEREPGYFREEVDAIRRANARDARHPAPSLPSLPSVKAVCQYTPRELAAELARQSRRLARADIGDFGEKHHYMGPHAAEDYTLARRAELGLTQLLEVAA